MSPTSAVQRSIKSRISESPKILSGVANRAAEPMIEFCNYSVGFEFFLFSKEKINAVTHPEATIINKSIGAKTIPGILLNIMPEPKLYKCPFSKNISPIYIRNVITEATIDGIQIETSFRFPKRNDPTNTPAVTPKRTKNIVINIADNGDTWMLPSLQNAVKQASIHKPRNEREQADCKIKELRRFFSPFLIICPKPYKQFKMVMINTTEII